MLRQRTHTWFHRAWFFARTLPAYSTHHTIRHLVVLRLLAGGDARCAQNHSRLAARGTAAALAARAALRARAAPTLPAVPAARNARRATPLPVLLLPYARGARGVPAHAPRHAARCAPFYRRLQHLCRARCIHHARCARARFAGSTLPYARTARARAVRSSAAAHCYACVCLAFARG